MAIFRSLLTFRKIPILSPSMEKATHSTVLAWEIPWRGSLVGYRPGGCKRAGHDLASKQQHNEYL